MKHIWDILSSSFPVKVTFGNQKEALAAPAPVASSSVVYVNDNLMDILLCLALIAVAFALIRSLSRQ